MPDRQPNRPAPRRLTITVPCLLYQRLLQRSDLEGRSLSNLAARLLALALPDS